MRGHARYTPEEEQIVAEGIAYNQAVRHTQERLEASGHPRRAIDSLKKKRQCGRVRGIAESLRGRNVAAREQERGGLSLDEFLFHRRTKDCPVCRLPADIRHQLQRAQDRGIKRRDQLDWLNEVVGVAITNADMTTHRSGRHDEAA